LQLENTNKKIDVEDDASQTNDGTDKQRRFSLARRLLFRIREDAVILPAHTLPSPLKIAFCVFDYTRVGARKLFKYMTLNDIYVKNDPKHFRTHFSFILFCKNHEDLLSYSHKFFK